MKHSSYLPSYRPTFLSYISPHITSLYILVVQRYSVGIPLHASFCNLYYTLNMYTLREMLSAANSDLKVTLRSMSKRNTSSKTSSYDVVLFDENAPKRVQEWTDFTYEAINAAYGNLLDEYVPDEVEMPVLSLTPTEIISEEVIDTLGIVWSCNVVRVPLKAASPKIMAQLKQDGPTDAQMVPKKTTFKHPAQAAISFNPDWSIKDRRRPTLHYTMGDSKLHYKWRSEWLASPGLTDRTILTERAKPLAQMATYCRYAGTRYGFIITDDELVALRIRRLPDGPKLEKYTAEAAVEYKSVKWAASGPRVLTVNLAIWALGMAGMNDKHRAMENFGDSMTRLTKWEAVPGKPDCARNVISGRLVKRERQSSPATFGDDGVSFTKPFTQSAALPAGATTSQSASQDGRGTSPSTGGGVDPIPSSQPQPRNSSPRDRGQGQQASSAQSSAPSRQSGSSASQRALPFRSGNPSQVPFGNPSSTGGRQQGSANDPPPSSRPSASSAQRRNQAPVDEPENTKKKKNKKNIK